MIARQKRTRGRRLAVASALMALGGGTVVAHPADPNVRVVLDEVVPEVPGLTVQVAASVTPQLVVENRTGEPLEVLADSGEAFLRVGPDGVEANRRSPAWFESNSPFGGARLPDGVDAAAPPQWVPVAAEPAWGWFDHRLHPPEPEVGQGWEVPMRLGGAPVVVRGHLERRVVTGVITPALIGPGAEGGQVEPLPGVVVQLLPGIVPGLFLRNDGEVPVIVVGAEGEPFLRVGPDGAEANLASPSWLAHLQAEGDTDAVDGLRSDPAAAPVWELVAGQPAVAWLEVRGRYDRAEPPAAVVEAGEPAVLVEWSVPLRAGAEEATIRGVTRFVPADTSVPTGGGGEAIGGIRMAALVAVVAVTFGALGLLVRGTRPRPS